MSGLFTYVEAGVLVGSLMIVLYTAAAGALAAGRVGGGLGPGALTLAWFVVLWEAARLGVFEGGSPAWRPAIAAAAALPLVGGMVGAGGLARRVVSTGAPLTSLIMMQICRLVSAALLIALAGEALPAWAAVPAAAGDLALAASTGAVARLVTRGDPRTPGVVLVWAAAGTAVTAYLVSVVLIAGRAATYFLTLYPLVLIPVFVAPAMTVLQVVALRAVEPREPAAVSGSLRPRPAA